MKQKVISLIFLSLFLIGAFYTGKTIENGNHQKELRKANATLDLVKQERNVLNKNLLRKNEYIDSIELQLELKEQEILNLKQGDTNKK